MWGCTYRVNSYNWNCRVKGNVYFYFDRYGQFALQRVCANSPPINIYGERLLPALSHQQQVLLNLDISAHMIGEKWYLTVILIFISLLMVEDYVPNVKKLFVFLFLHLILAKTPRSDVFLFL